MLKFLWYADFMIQFWDYTLQKIRIYIEFCLLMLGRNVIAFACFTMLI